MKAAEPSAFERLSLMPDTADKVSALETTEIVRFMNDFDLAGFEVNLSLPEIKGKWDEAFEKYQLLDEELNKRVESYQVPEVFMATAKKINTESGQVGLSLEKWKELVADWQKLKESDPRYIIARQLASAELPVNLHDRESMIKKAHGMIKRYFEGRKVEL